MFGVTKTPVLGVVENMAGFVCPSCGAGHAVFGKGRIERLAAAAGVPYLGALPVDADVSPQSDAGVPILAARPDGPAAAAHSRVASPVASAIGVTSCSTPLS